MTAEQDRHLSDAELVAIIDGTETLDAYAEHLDRCPSCRVTLTLAHSSAPTREAATMRIGRYEIRGLLGEGGMGIVYRAWDPAIHREVALKVWAGVSESAREKLLHEARVMGRLSHPGVCSVHDAGHDAIAGTFIATSLIEGRTLRHWMQGPATLRERIRVVRAVGEAIAVAHDAGVAHGDLKPENIVMRRDGAPVLTDFGLAAAEGRGPRGGTLGYAAPEQQREGATAKADQFALCTMAEELTSDPRLSRVWARGRSERPEERWPDMHALLKAIDWAQRGGARWVLALGVGVLSVGALFFVTPEPEPCPLDPQGQRAGWVAERQHLVTEESDVAQLQSIDGYVERWSSAAEQACKLGDGHVCLTRARAELTALRARLPDPRLEVAGWVARLPDPDACFDVRTFPGPSPALADARAMRLAGDPRGAARLAGRIALTTDDPGLATEAELLRGKSLVGVDGSQARDSLWRATVGASSGQRPDLEAEGLLGLAMLELQDASRIHEAVRLLARADALVQEHRPDLRQAVAFLRGLIASAHGDTEGAVRSMETAARLASESLPAGHPFRLQYSFEYGLALARAGRYQESLQSLESVRTLSVDQLGPEHPTSLNIEVEVAAQLANVGQWAQARTRLEAALPRLEASLGSEAPVYLDARMSLGLVLYELEEYGAAQDLFEALFAINDRTARPYAALNSACMRGDVEVGRSQWPAARERYQEALDYAADHELVGPKLGACLTRLGLTQRHLGEAACQATLERAVQILDLPSGAALETALAKFELARCIDDPARARTLATAALSGLSPQGAVADRRRREILGWLAELDSFTARATVCP